MADDSPTYILDSVVTDLTGTDEVQKITVAATAGTWTLTLDGAETSALSATATAATVQDAVDALPNVDSGDVVVSGGPGDKEGTTPYVFTFGGQWGDQNVPTITTDATELAGEGAKTAAVSTTTAGVGSAIQRGTGNADRTGDTSPLAGESPSEYRANNAATFGD